MTFAARYSGTCPACAARIDVGDSLAWDDDRQAVHAGCLGAEPRTTPVCQECWQAKAANGRCGCDEM